MQFNLDDTIAHLRRTPMVLEHLLASMPEAWTHGNYGPQTFSPFDVVGHLIHGERTDWMPRVRLILDHGEEHAFEPFDRYAHYEASRGKSVTDLLEIFASVRAENVASLESLQLNETDFQRRGTHPAFGSVTLAQLLATWVVHDLHHVAQICKAMSYQYREAVGPWRAYLGIITQAEAAAPSASASSGGD